MSSVGNNETLCEECGWKWRLLQENYYSETETETLYYCMEPCDAGYTWKEEIIYYSNKGDGSIARRAYYCVSNDAVACCVNQVIDDDTGEEALGVKYYRKACQEGETLC